MKKDDLVADLFILVKPRIVVLALLMATLGYFLGDPGQLDWSKFLGMLIGTGLVGAAACAFNQHAEIEVDRKMNRTKNRPLPAGRIAPAFALKVGGVMTALGVIILVIFVNTPTAVLGAFTLFSYIAIYTPAKPVSPLSTLIGAVPGALPPLIGYVAGRGTLGAPGLILFGILFLWQIPHFIAIGWLYREDYSRASLPILTVVDSNGELSSKQAILFSLALLPLSLVPTLWGMAGESYFVGALLLGLLFLFCSFFLAIRKTRFAARTLFIASLVYLPALGGLMFWDRLP
jgi:heme o synthase